MLIAPNLGLQFICKHFVFSKEIDAITAPPQPAESTGASSAPPPTPPRPEPKEPASSHPSATANGTGSAQPAEWQYDTQCSLAGGELCCRVHLPQGVRAAIPAGALGGPPSLAAHQPPCPFHCLETAAFSLAVMSEDECCAVAPRMKHLVADTRRFVSSKGYW